MKIKDQLYDYFVRKNERVCYEYERYVKEHIDEHYLNKLKHIRLLLKLNWHYRAKKVSTPLVYWDAENTYSSDRKKPTAKPRLVTPYIGAESEVGNRGKNVWWVMQLRKYDVISFDIFDTLILRPFRNPTDIFMVVGKRLGIPRFHQIRIDAERYVRTQKINDYGTREVTIYEIYEEIARQTGISAEYGASIELDVEKSYCIANPFIKQIFDMLKDFDKTIIVVSDMYIPSRNMQELLADCGYEDYTDLFVSCDYGCSKMSGLLYEIVKEKYPNKTIIHVGDNYKSDVEMAKIKGIETKYYKSCGAIGNPYRADGMSALIGSLYAGIVNNHLHAGTNTYSPYYEFGYIYGGIYVYAFCKWIYNQVILHDIDKVLFLSRDGDIYKKIFDMNYSEIESEYFLWSRVATIKYDASNQKAEFLKRQIINKVYVIPHIHISEVFSSLGISEMIRKYCDELDFSDYLTTDNSSEVCDFCINHWDELVTEVSAGKEFQLNAIRKAIGKAKKIAIVDVGWLGSGPLALKRIIKEEINDEILVKCYVAATGHTDRTYNICDVYSEDIEAFIFSENHNRIHFGFHVQNNKGMDNAFFELFTQATQPSYAGFDNKGRLLYDFPPVENYHIIDEIQTGICDFCNEYSRFAQIDSYLNNISGYDAYCPFRMTARNVGYYYETFKNFLYAFQAGIGSSYGMRPTIGGEMIRKGLIK